jgi:ribosomal protein S18 acetylase RimI-like enzyme
MENCRNKGIGGALVNAVLEALKLQQINKVALVVYSTNELGNHFWSQLGFDLTYRNISLNTDNN